MNKDVEAFLSGYYLRKGTYPKALFLPAHVYTHLEIDTRMRSMPRKPEPPKYDAGYYSSSGFFSSGYGEQYVYNFNDPLYLKELVTYEERLKEWRRTDRPLQYLGPFGTVYLHPGPFGQTEIEVIE